MYDIDPDRNYAAEMRAVIDRMTEGEYSSPMVAQKIVMKLTVEDPNLLHGWLLSQAADFIRQSINLRDASVRGRNRKAVSRSVFRQATGALEQGDAEPLTVFLAEVYVVEGGNRKALSQMTAADLTFASNDFHVRAAKNTLQATFLRVLSEKVGAGKVSDLYDENMLVELWRSIS
jgi:hypothetical protein